MRFRHVPILTLFLSILVLFIYLGVEAAADTSRGQINNDKSSSPKKEGIAREVSRLRAKADAEFVSGRRDSGKIALKLLNKVCKLEPDNHANFYKRYRVHLRLKKQKLALRDLQKAVAIKPTFTDGWVNQGKLLLKMGQCEEAQQALQQALVLDGRNKGASKLRDPAGQCATHLRAARAAEERGALEEAENHLTKAMEHSNAAAPLFLKRAQVRLKLGKFWEVLADSGKALKLDEGNLDALYIRASAYYRIGDHEMALRHHREGLRLDPEHKAIKGAYRVLKKITKGWERAEKYENEGRHSEAAEEYRNCAAIDPSHDEFNKKAWTASCRVQVTMGQAAVSRAREACDRALGIDGSWLEAQIQRAKTYALEEDWEQCVREWTRAKDFVEKGTRNNEVEEGLQKAQAALKQSKEKDYYKILGVRRDATKREIKSAYRKLALQWHPDKWSGAKGEGGKAEKAEQMFQDIGEAAEVLGDDEKRSKFDRGEPVFENQGGQGGGGGGGGFPHGFPFGGGGQKFHFQFRL